MLRLTGAALILGAALRLQRSLSVRGRLRRKTLRALANAFLSLESAVRSTLTPLPALLQELRCESEAASFFADVTAGLVRGEPLAAALNGEEESVCAALALSARELTAAEGELRQQAREQGRITAALCLGGGVMLCILLM